MSIMRLIFSNLLLYLALGACFKFTDAQVSTQTDITTTLANYNTVGEMFSSESTTAGHGHVTTAEPLLDINTVTELQTKPDLYHAKPTLVNQLSTMLEEPTAVNIMPLSTETEQTTTEFAPDQIEQTTMITTNVPPNVETAVAEQITSDAPSTRQYETTVGFTSSELTSPKEHPTDEITTAADTMSTDSTEALNPTSIPFQLPADWTASLSKPMETSIITSTATLTSSSQLSQITPEGHSHSTFDDESVFTQFTSVTTTGGNVEQSILPIQTNWLLIIVVCVTVICVLCVGMILFVQRRKKNASRTFGPMYVNGQSKRSKKKKGPEDDAWAGPVNLEAGVECDAEVQEGLLPDDGKKDGDDMVLSTFAALDEGDMSNGGVGGEGTKEAKKWEKQEPLLYIDEDVGENKAGETLAENKTQKGDDKSEEKELNGGETFCLTTAV
ncbi:mucin-4 [Rhinichthys klamathensis goyatoka]|uniref:mucin-4 n=1 Tax=Rhinichthys klamathensis goyatoka TaxID=3034132 RepID=UPI0024B5ABA8|nr:mucin-4 [Rhinichthys klamathensis goyatoka]XP_056111227.1 mucin-4 [Rhinichthys klamathensis goyatoka]